MESVPVLLLVLMLSSLQLSSSTSSVKSFADCCPEVRTMKIPLKLVVSYNLTRGDCFKKAVVFYTKKGRKICTDLDAKWVNQYITEVDKRIQ